jgi:iron complex outermembrane recepter protein
MNSAILRVTSVLAIAVCALMTSFGAKAATTPASKEAMQGLEEIIVTAQKREENISRVPISIAAFNQADLDARDIKSVGDIAKVSPGVDFRPVGYRNWIAIRGISLNAGGGVAATGADTTALYVDDAPIQARYGTAAVANAVPLVFDVDHIEVLRGPQGTVFGASAEGGAIRIISHAPSLTEYSGFARAEGSQIGGGGFNSEMGVAYGGPIVQDKLAFRVSAWASHDGGFVDNDPSQHPNDNQLAGPTNPCTPNLSSGDANVRVAPSCWPVTGGQVASNVNKAEKYVARAALLWKPSSTASVEAAFFYQKRDQNSSDLFDPLAGDPGNGTFYSTRGLLQPINDRFYTPSLKMIFDLGGVQLTSVTAYLRRDDSQGYDYTTVLPPAFGWPIITSMADAEPTIVGTNQDNFTQEVRLQSPNATDRFRWTVGLYYSDLRQHDFETVAAPSWCLVPDGLVYRNTGQTCLQFHGFNLYQGLYTYISDQYFDDKAKAVYANAEYDINAHFTVFGGARYEKQDSSYVTTGDGPLAGGPTRENANFSSSIVAPKAGINWKIDDRTLVYFSAAKGYRPGGSTIPIHLQNQSCIDQLNALGNPTGYKPDFLWSYEIGAKHTSADRRLSIDGSVFHIDWTDIISSIHIPLCATHVASNLGKAKSEGFDLSLRALLTDNWTAGLYLAYTNAQYTTDSTLFGETTARSGQAISDISPWNVTVEFGYQAPLAGNKTWYAHLEDRYNNRNNKLTPAEDKTLVAPVGGGYDPFVTTNPAVNQLNGHLGLRFPGGADLSLIATNLLNSHPVLNRYDGLIDITYGAFTVRPRTVGVSLLYHW